ncbi:hypothetical protein [Thalassotalea sp. G2M2-11]|uniref:hypothetical protein n=1 Tax=Thalassotalea sp. G2M2-11 TaxID=2787627 RepID=UPI0019D2C639|nr:hypothetical protein [Thalassotalea sp. G2M2-11]
MEAINKLELHYYFDDDSHDIDAITRNKCEAELLAIISEVATLLDIKTRLISEIPLEGGFKDKWKALGENSQQLQVILMAVGLVTTIYFTYDPEGDARTKELEQLQIQELKMKLQQINSSDNINDLAKVTAKKLSKNLKITKRKSNFYTHLNNDPKVKSISISALDNKDNPFSQEKIIDRRAFREFILSTNKLRAEEDDNAQIELISPVLKDGNYKWKGIYKDQTISFNMHDQKFKESIFIDGLNFHAGTSINCVLRINRELDEIGEVKIKGYSVPTVIEVLDGQSPHETPQGKAHRHAKSMYDKQRDMFV